MSTTSGFGNNSPRGRHNMVRGVSGVDSGSPKVAEPDAGALTDFFLDVPVDERDSVWLREVSKELRRYGMQLGPHYPELPPPKRREIFGRYCGDHDEQSCHQMLSSSPFDRKAGNSSPPVALPKSPAGMCAIAAAAAEERRASSARGKRAQGACPSDKDQIEHLRQQMWKATKKMKERRRLFVHKPLLLPAPLKMTPVLNKSLVDGRDPCNKDSKGPVDASLSHLLSRRTGIISIGGPGEDTDKTLESLEQCMFHQMQKLGEPQGPLHDGELESEFDDDTTSSEADHDEVSELDTRHVVPTQAPTRRMSRVLQTLETMQPLQPAELGRSAASRRPSVMASAARTTTPKPLLRIRLEASQAKEYFQQARILEGEVLNARPSRVGRQEPPHVECSSSPFEEKGNRLSHLLGVENAPPRLSRKSLFGGHMGTMDEESVLNNITLHSTHCERLARLRKLTTLHRAKVQRGFCVTTKECERFAEIFSRYDYNRSGGLDVVELHGALADLGLRPSNKKEKLELVRLVQGSEGSELDFRQFCRVVVARRKRAQEAQRDHLNRLFQQYDKDDSGALSADELMMVFNDLSLSPERDDERLAFLDAVREVDTDRSGEIEWSEFEILVQVVRERLAQCRREREVRISKQMKLPADIFLNFRPILTHMHDAFLEADSMGRGAVEHHKVEQLVWQLGFGKDPTTIAQLRTVDQVLKDLFDNHKLIDFCILLQIVQRLRELREESCSDKGLRSIFEMYDIDHSASLSMDEVHRILIDLGLAGSNDPKHEARVNQQLVEIFEETDNDGNGTIEYNEFYLLFHRVSEMLYKKRRDEERKTAESLGFGEDELRDMREIFAMLDKDGTGSLPFDEVVRAVNIVGDNPVVEETMQKYDGEHLGRLNFESFLHVIRDTHPTLLKGHDGHSSMINAEEVVRRNSGIFNAFG